MEKHILKHRAELGEAGVEGTPGEVEDWADDVAELFRDTPAGKSRALLDRSYAT